MSLINQLNNSRNNIVSTFILSLALFYTGCSNSIFSNKSNTQLNQTLDSKSSVNSTSTEGKQLSKDNLESKVIEESQKSFWNLEGDILSRVIDDNDAMLHIPIVSNGRKSKRKIPYFFNNLAGKIGGIEIKNYKNARVAVFDSLIDGYCLQNAIELRNFFDAFIYTEDNKITFSGVNGSGSLGYAFVKGNKLFPDIAEEQCFAVQPLSFTNSIWIYVSKTKNKFGKEIPLIHMDGDFYFVNGPDQFVLNRADSLRIKEIHTPLNIDTTHLQPYPLKVFIYPEGHNIEYGIGKNGRCSYEIKYNPNLKTSID